MTIMKRGKTCHLRKQVSVQYQDVEPPIPVTRALEQYWVLAADKTRGKSPDQLRRWEKPRKKAVKNFVEVVGDKAVPEITGGDMLDFRHWWMERLDEKDLTPNITNKDLFHPGDVLKTVDRMKRPGQWAITAEVHAINQLSKKFDEGGVGEKASGEAKQEQEFIRAIFQYVTADHPELPKLRTNAAMHADKAIPLSYLQQKLLSLAMFRNDRIGAGTALKRKIQNFVDDSDLLEIGKADLAARYNKSGRAYVVANPSRFIGAGSSK